jgi:hypothetical protein
MLFHLFGGRLGDNRDWAAIDEWAQTVLGALRRTDIARAV